MGPRFSGVPEESSEKIPAQHWKVFPKREILDGSNSALVIGLVLVKTNFEASKTLFLMAIQSLEN